MTNVLDVLRERGFVQDISDEEGLRRHIDAGPITLYHGIDATADSLHVGHLMSVMALSWYQRYGHRPIALFGGGTTLIGDPSGRQSSRPMLTEAEIDANVASIKGQVAHFVDFDDGRALVVNNADWLTKLNFVEFMRDIGVRFSVNEILRLEAYRTRLEAGGMTFLELTYVLMQSYDFLRLYQDHGCILQIGGSDQWGNSIMGADLVRRVTGGEAFVQVSPLLETADGRKMGKSEAGAVWLSAERTSPYDYYQYWRNIDDSMVERCLAIFTYLSMDEIRALTRGEGAELNRAKETLAYEATKLLHGQEEADRARAAAQALFGDGSADADIPTVEIDVQRLVDGMPVTELFKIADLVSSANEARSLIKQRGLSIDGEPVTDERAQITVDGASDGHLLLSRGRKRHKRVVIAR